MFFLTTGSGIESILYQVFLPVLSFLTLLTGSSFVIIVILLFIIHQLYKRVKFNKGHLNVRSFFGTSHVVV